VVWWSLAGALLAYLLAGGVGATPPLRVAAVLAGASLLLGLSPTLRALAARLEALEARAVARAGLSAFAVFALIGLVLWWFPLSGWAAWLTLALGALAVGAVCFRRLGEQRPRPEGGLLLDTSVLVDGRLVEIVRLGFLQGPLIVPDFVLEELQTLADSSDPAVRARGRRGFSTIDALGPFGLLVLDASGDGAVDDRILSFARSQGLGIVTNDNALGARARAYGLRVLNVNALAAALLPRFLPGQSLRVRIRRQGREPGQGIGYLDDGTLVVVEGAAEMKGSWVSATVVRVVQKPEGRMVFARLGA